MAQFLRLLRSGSDKFIVTSEGFLSLAIQQQLETPTLTSQRYFSSPISNQHIPAISDFIPSRRGFKIAHLNINSLTKHIDELRILLLDYSLNILKSFRNDIAQQDWTCKGSDLMILMFCGLTGKRNFWMLLTFMLHSELDALE